MSTCENRVSDSTIANAIERLFCDGGASYAYSRPLAGWEVRNISNFYGVHLAIWQLRPNDLQIKFPLNTSEQRADFLAWCVVHGQFEYQALSEVEAFWNELLAPAKLETTRWSEGISRLVQLTVRGRPDLMIEPYLRNSASQQEALTWMYVRGGWKELGEFGKQIPTWLRSFLLSGSSLLKSPLSRLVYESRDDIKLAFDMETAKGKHNYNHWLLTHGMAETFLGVVMKPARRSWPPQTPRPHDDGFGVNLIGYAYGELGIGEDVRMAARALAAVKVPFTIINVSPGANIRQNDQSVSQWVSDKPKYFFNIICLTALEHLRLYLEKGSSMFIGRYNIGYWPWELHDWPKKWVHCFNLVDEIWASSKHIQQSASRASHLTVRHMPMAVPKQSQECSTFDTRRRYQLPQSDTLFIFSFDGNSHTKRKNPSGILKAFNLAFQETEAVCLVIKCMRPDPENPEWRQILAQSFMDDRIKIIDSVLEKSEVMDLYQCCDCFVSLHRAEGFGRGIAEAHSLGLQVISTNYGGNVDFCKELGAQLIDYELTQMSPGDYVESDQNSWAEPDIAHAAKAMRSVHEKVQSDSWVGREQCDSELLDKIFSPFSIGVRYRNCLHGIHQLIQTK